MIEYLRIENLALLERAEIDFTEGFTAVTGETGAGKSVLLGALAMLSGARCGKEAVGGHSDTCRVEAVLRFKDTSKIDRLLESAGLPPCEDGTLLISRGRVHCVYRSYARAQKFDFVLPETLCLRERLYI